MALKPCRECKKEVTADAKTCPHCGVAHPAPSTFVAFATLILLVGSVAIGVALCSGDDPPAAPPTPAEPTAPAQPTRIERIEKAPTLLDAFLIASPIDSQDTLHNGVVLFAYWASRHMAWSDVFTEDNETSIPKVKKDPQPERSRRLCLSGSIVEIAKQDIGAAPPVFSGMLLAAGGEPVHFIAVRDTGDLVAGSSARFCGVVTGLYSYRNTVGGMAQAVQLVGIFDLPANTR